MTNRRLRYYLSHNRVKPCNEKKISRGEGPGKSPTKAKCHCWGMVLGTVMGTLQEATRALGGIVD